MITLTTPEQIKAVLGATITEDYNKLVVTPFCFDPVAQTINGNLQLTSTTSPGAEPINGTLEIRIAQSMLLVKIEQVRFRSKKSLTAGQNTAILNIIKGAQDDLENGLLSVGVFSGTQTPGV